VSLQSIRIRLVLSLALAFALSGGAHADWVSGGAPIAPGTSPHAFGSMVADGFGGAYIAWGRNSHGLGSGNLAVSRITRFGDVAPGWPDQGVPITQVLVQADGAELLAGDRNDVFVVWSSFPGPQVMALRLMGNARTAPRWPAGGVRVGPGELDRVVRAALVSDDRGGAIVFWRTSDAPPARGSQIRGQLVDAFGRVVWGADGVVFAADSVPLTPPQAIDDGRGGAFLAWSNGGTNPGSCVAIHVMDHGVVDSAWPAGGVALSNLDVVLGPVELVSDGRDGFIVGLQATPAGFPILNSDLYAQRVMRNGSIAPGWPAQGALVCNEPHIQSLRSVVSDETGGAIFVWQDFRPSALLCGVFAQRLDFGGHALWQPEGVPISVAPDFQADPKAASDSHGGAWMVWSDSRDGGTIFADIYASHVLGDGSIAAGVPLNGMAVSTADFAQAVPAIVADPGSDPVVAWNDYRADGSGGAYQVYLTQLSGTPRGAHRDDAPVVLGPPTRTPILTSAVGASRLSFTLPSGGVTRLEVFDVSGRRIESRELGMIEAGSHEMELSGLRGRSAGVYLLRLTQGEKLWNSRIMLLR